MYNVNNTRVDNLLQKIEYVFYIYIKKTYRYILIRGDLYFSVVNLNKESSTY